MMCGLPASGKTHWVREHVNANVDKRYTVLGNTNLLEKMTVNLDFFFVLLFFTEFFRLKVSGEPLRSKFKGRWSLLIDKVQKCLNRLITIGASRRRNYIIDQVRILALKTMYMSFVVELP